MNARPRPLVLCILDGWGERQKADASSTKSIALMPRIVWAILLQFIGLFV